MILADPNAATQRRFDVLVIGGGIYGAAMLQEAARQGLSACLCEAGDFGSGTSWNSLRIVHGGLRYLQTADLRRFQQSVAARRQTAQQFPGLVRPLDCVMPLYGRGLKRPSVMRLALKANDALSARRNRGVEPRAWVAQGQVMSADATRRLVPEVRSEGLRGAARWNDLLMVSSERILVELLRDAGRRGAMALNYSRVLEVLSSTSGVAGVRVRCGRDGTEREIQAARVVNCAGPWATHLAQGHGGVVPSLFHPSLAFNLLLDVRFDGDAALAVSAPDPGAPVLFLVPQEGSVLAGTMHLARPPGTTEAVVTEAELERFLSAVNRAVPRLGVTRASVRRVFAGLLPAAAPQSAELLKREIILDHGHCGGTSGFFSVSGVKFTTANAVGQQVLKMMGFRPRASDCEAALPVSADSRLLTDARLLFEEDAATTAAALRRTAAEEAVTTLEDLVLRRTNWAMTQCDLEPVFERVAGLSDLPRETTAIAAKPSGRGS